MVFTTNRRTRDWSPAISGPITWKWPRSRQRSISCRSWRWVERQETIRRLVPPLLRRAVGAAAALLPSGVRGRGYLMGCEGDLSSSLGYVNLFFDVAARRRLLAPLGMEVTREPEDARTALGAYGGSALQRAT